MLKPFITALLLGLSTATIATGQEARLYRYYDDNHRPTITDSVTYDHITRGYDELTSSLQFLRHIPAQRILNDEEQAAARAKREAAAQRKRDDEQLQRLYATVRDAESARDRQIDALQLLIDYDNNTQAGLRQKRTEEAKKAAGFERAGKPVPKELRSSISNLDRQIQSYVGANNERRAEQNKIRKDFQAVIERLKFLNEKKSAESPSPDNGK